VRVTLREVLGELRQPAGRKVLLNALEARPNPVVYLTLDSRQRDSRGMVEWLLVVLDGYLWEKTEHQPATLVDVTLIDTDISSTWVRKAHLVRNLSYYPNVHSPAVIDSVVQGHHLTSAQLSVKFSLLAGFVDLNCCWPRERS
jgi:hypothetical protein